MKTMNLKSILPLLLMVLAITSAFALNAEAEKPAAAPELGWVDHPAPCSIQATCDNAGTEICTAMYQGQERNVRGKVSPNDLTCAKTLFKVRN